jgi:fermentation-respiration switch protein FrsA (DUF1100 family)
MDRATPSPRSSTSSQGFEESKKYPAIVLAHPGGGVKQQTADLYARKLGKKGSSALLLTPPIKVKARASHVNWRTPYIRTEDISGVIDYLTTLPYVIAAVIGAMGI